jgi:hypothetical protein
LTEKQSLDWWGNKRRAIFGGKDEVKNQLVENFSHGLMNYDKITPTDELRPTDKNIQ